MASNSENAGLGMTYQEPESLAEPNSLKANEGDNIFSLQSVSPDNRHYKEIQIDFQNAGLTVLKIEKLGNQHLMKRYFHERNLLLEQRKSDPDFKLNEKYLYHGTSVLKSSLCEEGLDSRMSKEGCFGKGIYFSDYPKKCVKYAQKGGNIEPVILLVRVMLGESKIYRDGQKDKTLVREPEKTQPYKGHRFYDSVQGRPRNHKEFVVYESRRALVEYIISYKKVDNQTKPLGESIGAQNTSASRSSDSDSSLSDDEFQDFKGKHNSSSDDDSNSDDEKPSDDEDFEATESDMLKEELRKMTNSSSRELLNKKKKEFSRRTGVVDQLMIEHCLLKGDLDVKQAIKVYNEMPKEEELRFNNLSIDAPEAVTGHFDYEDPNEDRKPDPPTSDSVEWAQMKEEDREAIIKNLVEDFLHVTGLTEADEQYARTCLAKTNHQLDFAILAYYEEMSSLSGDI